MQQEQKSAELATTFPMQRFAEFGHETLVRMLALQKEYLETIHDGMNAEAALMSELFTKLAAAKSMPDAASACQKYGSRQMEIIANQNHRLMAAGEKIAPHLFSDGFKSTGI